MYQTCEMDFFEERMNIKVFLLHEASTYIFQDMTKDSEVPFVPSKSHEI